MTKATGCPVEPVVSPPFRGIEVGSNEGFENCKRGVTMDSAYLKADSPGKEETQ
jgi:hypothetical protein